MELVWITALGVGSATIVGSIIGLMIKEITHKFSDIVLSFAAGIMLAASILGLILPSVDYGGRLGVLVTVAGIFVGAVCLNLIDKFVPHLHKLAGVDSEEHNNADINKVLLFVTAVAIHNLPEGIAAGVGFGSGDMSQALMIAGGIALQNIPEGMVIIAPMLAAGISAKRTFICAVLTGLIEIVGTFIGYFAVSVLHRRRHFAMSMASSLVLFAASRAPSSRSSSPSRAAPMSASATLPRSASNSETRAARIRFSSLIAATASCCFFSTATYSSRRRPTSFSTVCFEYIPNTVLPL